MRRWDGVGSAVILNKCIVHRRDANGTEKISRFWDVSKAALTISAAMSCSQAKLFGEG